MRIISYNVNGIRSAISKGFFEWLDTHPAEVICLQETKAVQQNIDCGKLEEMGYHHHWFSAQKKGYSGVAVFSRMKPDYVQYGHKLEQSDFEGRVIRADFGDVTILNAYFPSGTSGDLRQNYKYQWLAEWFDYLQELRKLRPKLVVVGDYNIAHREIDIHDPKGNKNSSGFLPDERKWMDNFFDNNWIDSFRELNPAATGAYSWWSQRFPAVRAQNKGWRIDYICITSPLRNQLKDARIYPEVKHSDHCPIYAEIETGG